MALMKCPECGKQVSTATTSYPHCGYPLEKEEPTQYEAMTVKVRCWGRNPDALNDKLWQYTTQGWEVVSTIEDHGQVGVLSLVYKVWLKRPKRN